MGDDEAATVKTLETYKGVMFSLIKQHRGRVVDSPGDNLLAEFGSVVDAVQCAVSVQKELQTRNADLPENRRMEFRIGINLGDVIEEEDRIYGDGVNIAARLEALADPGGICISKTAFDYIENKLPFSYRFIGEQAVKNIAKPIGAYKVLMETRLIDEEEKKAKMSFWQPKAVLSFGIIIILAIAAVLYWNFYARGPSIKPAAIERMAHPLPEKPSIAVLPFNNMSGDSEQDYIGDGLSENIISALSVSSELFVIARNSTFTYRGKPVKVQKVAEDLGVQYVLEGSIQKSGNRLRVTAQLIDALTGHHLWSEVYNRKIKELFDLQDEITKKIMVSLQVELSGSEDLRVYAKSTDNLEAWKHYIKGVELYENLNAKDNLKAREHFETALELDPKFVAALSKLAETHDQDVVFEWNDSPINSMNRAIELAQKAVELDEQDPYAHAALGSVLTWQKQFEKAITEGRRAITLNPNYAYGYVILAGAMHFSGQFDEAITLCKKAFRLNPIPQTFSFYIMASSYIFLERYEEALEAIRKMEERALPGSRLESLAKIHFSWVYEELGREEEARVHMREALKLKPDYSLENVVADPYKDPAHLQRRIDALRKAGMPEHPPEAVQEKPSIAVLPFENLSSDPEQEYFVDGLTEELITNLFEIPDLQVTSRTSSFSFKGTDTTVKEIAEILGREYILEGSVRKAGNELRVTVHLIRAELWAYS
jgi:adenylate cyclase